jgi:hypothetical protein
MNTLILPEPIAAYFAADKHNAESVARCFAPQAIVKDEGHTHSGRAAITAWKTEASARYTYTTTPLRIETRDGMQVVRSRVTGNFPGSPIDLDYRFKLVDGVIASLEITA